jgi:hypothetical protein
MTGREVHVDVTGQVVEQVTNAMNKQMVQQFARWCDAIVLAMRAEGVSDETAARVLNRVVTGIPDPDAVITFDPRTGDIQRAAGRHVRD